MSTCFMLVMMGSMKGFHLSSHATFQISIEISIHQLNVGIQLLDTIRKHLNTGGCLGRYGSIRAICGVLSSDPFDFSNWRLNVIGNRLASTKVPKNCVSCGYQKIGTSFQQLKGIQLRLVILWLLKLLQAGNHTASSCNPTLNKDQMVGWS